MEDRAVAGALAGFASSILQEGYAQVIKAVEVTDRSYGDFAFCLVTSNQADEIPEMVVGILSNIAIGILMGVIFAFLLKIITSKHLFLKGFFYGYVLWMLLLGFGSVFRLPEFTDMKPVHSLVALGGSIIWGAANAYFFKLFYRRNAIGDNT